MFGYVLHKPCHSPLAAPAPAGDDAQHLCRAAQYPVLEAGDDGKCVVPPGAVFTNSSGGGSGPINIFCNGNGVPNFKDGTCVCNEGFVGDACVVEVRRGFVSLLVGLACSHPFAAAQAYCLLAIPSHLSPLLLHAVPG